VRFKTNRGTRRDRRKPSCSAVSACSAVNSEKDGERIIGRRAALCAGIQLGVGLSLSPLVFAQDDPTSVRPQEGDLLVKVGDSTLQPLGPADVAPGAMQILAWPMIPIDNVVRSGSRLNQLVVVRLDPSKLGPATAAIAADGIVAYSAICTHNGCEVSDWSAEEQLLTCPCHLTSFDPKDGARVVDGPAPRALPALPLRIAGGMLVVAGPLTARVGFQSP
jgi:Rieske Fe-S protein